jgi:hypothetical protein
MKIFLWNFDRDFLIFFVLFVWGTIDAKLNYDYAFLVASGIWGYVWTVRTLINQDKEGR